VDLLAIGGTGPAGAIALSAADTAAGLQINLFWIIVAAANFVVFFLIVQRIAFGGLVKTLNDRHSRIEAGLQDADPLVRAAAVEAVGQWGEPDEAVVAALLPLLEDANDQVKVEVTKVLPKLAGATPAVIDGCSDLLVDVFGEAGRHTRSAVGLAELPFGIAVEIELTARLYE